MSVPCGVSDDLPIGMMLVARHCAESTIYRAAAAFERDVDWTSL
jgi:amidase